MLDRRPARVTGRQVPPRHLRWGSGSGAIYQRATHKFCGRGKVINIAASGDAAHVVMPRVHRVASLFSRVWLGTHQGAIRPSHLAYYLDEFTFRFNRRNSKTRGLLFYRLMEQAVDCAPAPRKILIGGQPQPVVRG